MYIPYNLSNKVIEWKPKCITPGPPIQWPEWNKKPTNESQISELLARITILRQSMLTGETVMFDWMKRRIQPLQCNTLIQISVFNNKFNWPYLIF